MEARAAVTIARENKVSIRSDCIASGIVPIWAVIQIVQSADHLPILIEYRYRPAALIPVGIGIDFAIRCDVDIVHVHRDVKQRVVGETRVVTAVGVSNPISGGMKYHGWVPVGRERLRASFRVGALVGHDVLAGARGLGEGWRRDHRECDQDSAERKR